MLETALVVIQSFGAIAIDVILSAGPAVLAAAAICTFAEWLYSKWGEQSLSYEEISIAATENDNKAIEETKKLIDKHFGENIAETIRGMSDSNERIEKYTQFAEELKLAYGLSDVTVEMGIFEEAYAGEYRFSNKKALFNLTWMSKCIESSEYERAAREMVDTIIHELRHAIQYKAVAEDDFWDFGFDVRAGFANNMLSGNYINPEVDKEAYIRQPIEYDAFLFAYRAMEGVR